MVRVGKCVKKVNLHERKSSAVADVIRRCGSAIADIIRRCGSACADENHPHCRRFRRILRMLPYKICMESSAGADENHPQIAFLRDVLRMLCLLGCRH